MQKLALRNCVLRFGKKIHVICMYIHKVMRHVPNEHHQASPSPSEVIGLPMRARKTETTYFALARSVNQQSYGGPITIRRALISHNVLFFVFFLFFLLLPGPSLATIGRVARGRQWVEPGSYEPIDFHDFSITFQWFRGERTFPAAEIHVLTKI